MPRNFSIGIDCVGRDIVLYIGMETLPSIFASNKFQGPVLSEVPGEGMIMLIPEDSETEVV